MTDANTAFDPIVVAFPTDAQLDSEATTEKERTETIEWIRKQVELSSPVEGTPAEKYLTEHRGLQKPYPASLKWAAKYQHKSGAPERACLLSVVTNDKNEIVALQSLQIDIRTGQKARREKPDRFSNGPVSEGAVFLGLTEDPSPTLVVGEGVETTVTRSLVGGCDGYACLGSLRFIEPKKHHKRVEILADNDKRDAARRLARQYAERGMMAHVVTVPEALGDKADLNDIRRNRLKIHCVKC